jgi:hypothetical protein
MGGRKGNKTSARRREQVGVEEQRKGDRRIKKGMGRRRDKVRVKLVIAESTTGTSEHIAP